jgi:3-deoxy-D-manno-octulosonic-acid transferase
MYILYSILMVAWGLILFPSLLIKWWRNRKASQGIRQRFGRLPESLRAAGRPTLWFHACSVGEALSIQPLAQMLNQRFPEARFVFSTITHGGQLIAEQRFARYGAGNVFYFPIDLSAVAKRVIGWIRPSLVVFVDTEIWPNIIHQLRRQNIPVVLVNGRISTRSFPYYRFFRPFLRRVFRDYALLMMKSEEDAERIRLIGAPADRVVVSGNIKYDGALVEKEITQAQSQALREALGLGTDGDSLLVAGSTHSGEEQILLYVLHRIRKTAGLEHTRLLIAPRHAERFDAVALLAERAGFRVRRRSGSAAPAEDAEVLLLDTIGELATAYRFASIAFVGGTLVRKGGHSIMEPAMYAKPIIIGPSMENFPQIADEFLIRGGIRQIKAGEEDPEAQVEQLLEAFIPWLRDPSAGAAAGRAAYSVLEVNRGAAERMAGKIAALLGEAGSLLCH